MKRVHVHIGVKNLEEAIRFYSGLFNSEPVKTKPGYAKWLLDDPAINLAVSTQSSKQGIDHLGIQVDDSQELKDLRARLEHAEMSTFDEGEAVCCYARSDKTWVQDPAEVPWEVYRTMEDAEVFSCNVQEGEEACCTPQAAAQSSCTEGSTVDENCCAA